MTKKDKKCIMENFTNLINNKDTKFKRKNSDKSG